MFSPTVTRRRALQTTVAAALLGRAQGFYGQTTASPHHWLLFGGTQGKGIYRAAWNSLTGEVGPAELAATTPQPTWLTRHPYQPVLYACNEAGTLAESAVSAFYAEPRTAQLTPLGRQQTNGIAPCHASVDHTGSLLFAANYGGGSLAVLPLDRQGRPQRADAVFHCTGSSACGTGGPVADRQSAPHIHCATLSPDNRFVLACDLGDDVILAFPIHPHTPHPLGPPTRIPTASGAGPRHLAFHPDKRWLYCISELNCTVSLYRWQPVGQRPAADPVPDATVSVLPPAAQREVANSAAELAFSADGRFLYTSTRFCDVLTVFAVHPDHGRLTQIQQVACGGETPRALALDPSERWVISANQDSNTLSVFARDLKTGRITLRKTYPAINPECVMWL